MEKERLNFLHQYLICNLRSMKIFSRSNSTVASSRLRHAFDCVTFKRKRLLEAAKATEFEFTPADLMFVIAIIGTLIGALLIAAQSTRDGACRAACQHNLNQNCPAILSCEAAHCSFQHGATPATHLFKGGVGCLGAVAFISNERKGGVFSSLLTRAGAEFIGDFS